MSWTHRTLVVPAAYRDLAWTLANGITPGGPAEGMWTTELSATGDEPATHYISSGYISPESAALLGNAQATYDAAGGQVPLADIEALYANSVIRADEDPHAVIAELGLQFVRREL